LGRRRTRHHALPSLALPSARDDIVLVEQASPGARLEVTKVASATMTGTIDQNA